MSLPRVVSLAADGRLRITPAPELETLRGKHHHFGGQPARNEFSIRGDSLEIQAEFELGTSDVAGLTVRSSPRGEEHTSITYHRTSAQLLVEREHSSLSPDVDRGPQGGSFTLAENETLKLRIFLDASVIEIFANDRACLTSRVYPSRPDSLDIGRLAKGGSARLKALDVWEMRSISADRLTT
jgi:beta-fructofuranosidase